MAVRPTDNEIKQQETEYQLFLEKKKKELEAKFGSELGLAVHAYLYGVQENSSEDAQDLKRSILAEVIALSLKGEGANPQNAISLLLWLNEQTAESLQRLRREYSSDKALY